MKPLFADASFYIALLNQGDELFPLAKPYAADVTTEFVIIEVANFFARFQYRQKSVELYSRLIQSASTRIFPASSDLFSKGFELYKARSDKDWSLTDCCSFVVMEELKLEEALPAISTLSRQASSVS